MPKVIYYAGTLQQAGQDEESRVKDLLYDKVMEKGAEYDRARVEALVEFACWFWSSTAGGFAHYLEQHPDEWESFQLEIGFARDDGALWKAIAYCLPYFRYGPDLTMEGYQVKGGQVVVISNHRLSSFGLVQSYSKDELLEAVKLAYDGHFGDVPPLTEDHGYAVQAETLGKLGLISRSGGAHLTLSHRSSIQMYFSGTSSGSRPASATICCSFSFSALILSLAVRCPRTYGVTLSGVRSSGLLSMYLAQMLSTSLLNSE